MRVGHGWECLEATLAATRPRENAPQHAFFDAHLSNYPCGNFSDTSS